MGLTYEHLCPLRLQKKICFINIYIYIYELIVYDLKKCTPSLIIYRYILIMYRKYFVLIFMLYMSNTTTNKKLTK